MSLSTSVVQGRTYFKQVKTVKHSDLKIGDLFKNKANGRTYAYTGARTMPPSGRTVSIQVGAQTVQHEVFKSLGRNAAGQDVIAYQSMIVEGAIKPGSDGSAVSFQNGDVLLVGKFTVALQLFS